jgi:hypothetical protein
MFVMKKKSKKALKKLVANAKEEKLVQYLKEAGEDEYPEPTREEFLEAVERGRKIFEEEKRAQKKSDRSILPKYDEADRKFLELAETAGYTYENNPEDKDSVILREPTGLLDYAYKEPTLREEFVEYRGKFDNAYDYVKDMERSEFAREVIEDPFQIFATAEEFEMERKLLELMKTEL